jgi:ATP sulfurylase|nr:hypothetical protein [Nostoc sp. ZfuVER08]
MVARCKQGGTLEELLTVNRQQSTVIYSGSQLRAILVTAVHEPNKLCRNKL